MTRISVQGFKYRTKIYLMTNLNISAAILKLLATALITGRRYIFEVGGKNPNNT